jgi:hypothetical protein
MEEHNKNLTLRVPVIVRMAFARVHVRTGVCTTCPCRHVATRLMPCENREFHHWCSALREIQLGHEGSEKDAATFPSTLECPLASSVGSSRAFDSRSASPPC